MESNSEHVTVNDLEDFVRSIDWELHDNCVEHALRAPLCDCVSCWRSYVEEGAALYKGPAYDAFVDSCLEKLRNLRLVNGSFYVDRVDLVPDLG
ncbi:MAG: hypothetical protein ACMXYK_05625 [Candidatus Woesearchaeota archaeon]